MNTKSRWRSARVCDQCWNELNPDRMPVRVIDAELDACIWCGEFTVSGIGIRVQLTIPVFDELPA